MVVQNMRCGTKLTRFINESGLGQLRRLDISLPHKHILTLLCSIETKRNPWSMIRIGLLILVLKSHCPIDRLPQTNLAPSIKRPTGKVRITRRKHCCHCEPLWPRTNGLRFSHDDNTWPNDLVEGVDYIGGIFRNPLNDKSSGARDWANHTEVNTMAAPWSEIDAKLKPSTHLWKLSGTSTKIIWA